MGGLARRGVGEGGIGGGGGKMQRKRSASVCPSRRILMFKRGGNFLLNKLRVSGCHSISDVRSSRRRRLTLMKKKKKPFLVWKKCSHICHIYHKSNDCSLLCKDRLAAFSLSLIEHLCLPINRGTSDDLPAPLLSPPSCLFIWTRMGRRRGTGDTWYGNEALTIKLSWSHTDDDDGEGQRRTLDERDEGG